MRGETTTHNSRSPSMNQKSANPVYLLHNKALLQKGAKKVKTRKSPKSENHKNAQNGKS